MLKIFEVIKDILSFILTIGLMFSTFFAAIVEPHIRTLIWTTASRVIPENRPANFMTIANRKTTKVNMVKTEPRVENGMKVNNSSPLYFTETHVAKCISRAMNNKAISTCSNAVGLYPFTKGNLILLLY